MRTKRTTRIPQPKPKRSWRLAGLRLDLEYLEVRNLLSFGSLVQAGLSQTPFTNTGEISGQSGSVALNSEVEPYAAVDPTNPKHIVGVWQQDRWSNGGSRGIVAGVSTDGGNTWADAPIPGTTVNSGGTVVRASDPWVSIGPDGRVYASYLELPDPNVGNPTGLYISTSSDGGYTWANPVPAITNPGDTNVFDDKDSITADPYTAGEAYVVWDRLNFSQNIGPAMFSRTTDGGQTWSAPVQIVNPTNGQTIGNQIVVLPGDVLVDVTISIDYATNANIIVAMRSTDHGATWSAPVTVNTINDQGVTDPNNGAGVRDGGGIPEIAVDRTSGNMYVVWQDNRFTGTHDDVALSTSSDGGLTWSSPIKVNQTPTNIPVGDQQAFTPQVAVEANGIVAVSYYDFRNNTGAGGLLTDYWVAFANPAQANFSFGNEQRLTNTSFNMELAPYAYGEFVGDYEALVSGGSTTNTVSAFFGQAVSTSTPSAIFYRGIVPPNTLSLSSFAPPTGVVEGASAGGTLATFGDVSPHPDINTYTAVVTWGDGSTDTLTAASGGIVSNGGGSFSVVDSHTYAEESAGESFSVQITDNGGGSAGSSGSVAVADAALTAGALTPPTAVEGQGVSNATVFHFNDADPAGAASDYSANVTLGDGNSVTLTSTPTANGQIVANAGGGFDVQLSYSYAEELSGKTFAVLVTDSGGSTASGSTGSFSVADAPLTASPVTFSASENGAVSGVTVATFTDADPAGTASDYHATVNWGDGDATASVSVVADSVVAGQFDVIASKSHPYAEGGHYTVAVSIGDAGGATATAPSTAVVADPAITVTGTTFTATEGKAFSGTVGTFNDADTVEPVSSYTAAINWGDGNTSSGTVLTTTTKGHFKVTGTHTYAEAGSPTVVVTITDAGGASALASTAGTVKDAALSGSAVSFTAVKNQAFTGQVASFTDANPTAPLSDFSATVNWGDGHSSTATVATNPAGGFQVNGSHTYTKTGKFNFTVTIKDVDGSKISAKGTATITTGAAVIVGGGGNSAAVFAVSPSGNLSWHQSSGWKQIGSYIDSASVTTDSSGRPFVFAVTIGQDLFRFDPVNGWARLGAGIVSVSAVNDVSGRAVVFAVTASGDLFRFDAVRGWQQFGSFIQSVSASTNASGQPVAYVVTVGNDLFRFDTTGGWVRLGSSIDSMSATAGGGQTVVYAVTLNNDLFRFDSSHGWVRLGSSILSVSAGTDANGNPKGYATTIADAVFASSGANTWQTVNLPVPITSITGAAANRVLALGSNGSVFQYDDATGWLSLGTPS